MSSRGGKPDTNSLNILLRRHLRAYDLKAAVDAVLEFNTTYGIIPDELSLELLFRLAWTKQSFNICRILWAASCTYKRTPFRMREQILESLTGKKTIPLSSSRRRPRGPGYLMIGLDPLHHNLAHKFLVNTVPASRNNPKLQSLGQMISGLISRSDSLDDKLASRRDATAFMEHDQILSAKYLYNFPMFKSQLRTALEMDEALDVKEFMELPLESQLEQMIQPRLIRRVAAKKRMFATVN